MIRTQLLAVSTLAAAVLPAVAAEPRAEGVAPPATTVVTHGFQLGGQIPDWPFALADAIARRAGQDLGTTGRVLVYDADTGDLSDCVHPQCTASGSGATVIVFDWAADSNESGSGFSEAAAETLFAGLVEWSQETPPLVNLSSLHLIGHSRGAIVNSEVAERLIAAGLPAPDQVTSLDPNDSGGALRPEGLGTEEVERGGLDDYDVNQEHPEYDCHAQNVVQGICSWAGVGYQDNYWQNDPGCFALLPDGLELFGSANFNQNSLDSPFCHSDTHRWYLLTADTTAPTHPVTGNPPGPDWYGIGTECLSSPRSVPLSRSSDGFNFSAIAGGEASRCPIGPGQKQVVLFDFGLAEGLVNGDFERNPSAGAESGWSFHGGGLQATVDTDTDRFLNLAGGDWARHNRFHIPISATAIQLCRKVALPGSGDTLSLLLEISGRADREMLIPAQQATDAATEWECFEAPFEGDELGRRATILVSLSNLSSPNVHVDDFRLSTGLFADGFESGDASAWDGTSP